MKRGLILKLFSLLLVLVITVPILSVKSSAAVSNTIFAIYFAIYINPAFDCSTRMNISWLSLEERASITYTKASDPFFLKATTVEVLPTKNPITYSDFDKDYYSYEISLKNLSPNTEYIFYVTDKNGNSNQRSFKTAREGENTSFSFLALSDVHGETQVHKDVRLANDLASKVYGQKKYDFILSTGDMVGAGGNLTNWLAFDESYITSNFMYAQTPGNHEYYKDSVSKNRITNLFMANLFNNPKNGAEGLETSYWFLYNNVLFISIDSQAADGEGAELNEELKKFRHQSDWFRSVVDDNAGSYKYIVVFVHYSPFNADGGTPSGGKYRQWSAIFDEYGVDLVLSGHEHTYIRTHQIYNNEVSTDNLVGTVYITLPKISSKNNLYLEDGSGLIAKVDKKERSGVGLFEVSDNGITFSFYDVNGSILDTTLISSKERSLAPHKTNAYKAYQDTLESFNEVQRLCGLATSQKSQESARDYIKSAEELVKSAKEFAEKSRSEAEKSKETESFKVALLANLKSNLALSLANNAEEILNHAKDAVGSLPKTEKEAENGVSFFAKYKTEIISFTTIFIVGGVLVLIIALDNKRKPNKKK